MKRLKLKNMNFVQTKVNKELIDPKTYIPSVKITPRKKDSEYEIPKLDRLKVEWD